MLDLKPRRFQKTSLKKLLPFYKVFFINWKTRFSSGLENPAKSSLPPFANRRQSCVLNKIYC